ncbi:MAG TPA: hypothetical protein VJT10_09935 [Steroidobacteraceae bacterium]|nr:hypothetical protein [Steroidobacteraceae bacterium]
MAAEIEMGAAVRKQALVATLALLAPALSDAAPFTFIVAGLGGEPEYEQRFREQAAAIAEAAEKAAGAPGHVVVLTGDQARRESLRRELAAFADKVKATDSATIVLIGHGTYDGEDYRFNVPGTDLTGGELGELFDKIPAKQQLIVNATSASGATIDLWKRPERVVITATKSGGERTATRFAQFWVQAVSGDGADVNKDQVVTAAEAFDYANRQVAASYKADVSLATEHARMAADETAAFTVARVGGSAISSSNPEVAALLAERGQIEHDLNGVKERKAALSQDEYYDELEAVLVRLALLQKQIDAKQGAR